MRQPLHDPRENPDPDVVRRCDRESARAGLGTELIVSLNNRPQTRDRRRNVWREFLGP
jgi:hypothetical protein